MLHHINANGKKIDKSNKNEELAPVKDYQSHAWGLKLIFMLYRFGMEINGYPQGEKYTFNNLNGSDLAGKNQRHGICVNSGPAGATLA